MVAAAAAAAVVLAGCSSTTHGDPKHGATTDRATRVAVYLSVVRKDFPQSPDRDLLDLGRQICGAFHDGGTWQDLVRLEEGNGISPYRAGHSIGAAVGALCPQYQNRAPK